MIRPTGDLEVKFHVKIIKYAKKILLFCYFFKRIFYSQQLEYHTSKLKYSVNWGKRAPKQQLGFLFSFEIFLFWNFPSKWHANVIEWLQRAGDGFTQDLFLSEMKDENSSKGRKYASLRPERKHPAANTASTVCCETKEFSASAATKIGAAVLSLPLWRKFSFSSTETAPVVCFMYSRIGSRDKYNKNYIPSIVALRRLSPICVFGENRVDVTRMRYMLIQSARRWINKFPRRAHRRICIIKKRRRLSPYSNAFASQCLPGNTRAAPTKGIKHRSARRRLHNFEYFSLSFLWGNVKFGAHTLHIHCVDTLIKK